MIRKEIRYSELGTREMFAMYNDHAAKLGVPPLARCPSDRGEMAKHLALIMTRRPKPLRKVRDVVIEELCKVAFYRDDDGKQYPTREQRGLVPVGFPYAVVLQRVKIECPTSKISMAALLVHATNIRKRKKGYRKATMPEKRQRATSKESKHD